MGLFAWETQRSKNGEIRRASETRQALDLDSLSLRDLAPETSHCRSPMARQSPEGDEAKMVSPAPSTPYGLGPLHFCTGSCSTLSQTSLHPCTVLLRLLAASDLWSPQMDGFQASSSAFLLRGKLS